MVIPNRADRLEVGELRGPLLDDYYGSAIQKADVMAIAEEIKRRHLALLPSQTGNLKSTAKVTAHRSTVHRDRRYEAEYSIGGPRADYIVPLEDEHHYLDRVLREMGFYTGDIVNGPTGKVPAAEREPRRLSVLGKTDSEHRADVLEAQLAYAKRMSTPEVEARRQAAEERAIEQDRADALDALRRTRPGTKSRARAEHWAQVMGVMNDEVEAGINSGEQTQRPEPRSSSRRVRAGLYEVSGGDKSYMVEQRMDIPGQPWWASDPDATFDPHMGSFSTKREAVQAMRDIIEGGDE